MKHGMIVVSVLVLLAVALGGLALPVESSDKGTLMDPSALTEKAPDAYKVKLQTSKGDLVIEVHREWAPLGADRFYNLVKNGFYDDVVFFRVVPGFMVQFGLNGDPQVSKAWSDRKIKDDPVVKSNKRGFITYAKAPQPDTRTTQVFINLADNVRLDQDGFAPFGQVVEGMDVVDQLHGGYGDGPPRGRGPEQGRITREGNAYLKGSFSKLDSIVKATLLQ